LLNWHTKRALALESGIVEEWEREIMLRITNSLLHSMETIKVQIIGGVSTKKSAIESGFDAIQHPLTFHAYSDTMKARILEVYLKNPDSIVLSLTDESPRDGEWHEPLIFNSSQT